MLKKFRKLSRGGLGSAVFAALAVAFLPSAALLTAGSSCSPAASAVPDTCDVTVDWAMVNLNVDSGPSVYRQRIVVRGDMNGVRRIAFNQFARPMSMADSTDTLTEIIPGYYALSSPKFADMAAGKADSVVMEIITRGRFVNVCNAPDGFHAVFDDGSTAPVRFRPASVISDVAQWKSGGIDRMPYGEEIFDENEELAALLDSSTNPLDVIPAFKSVRTTGGNSVCRVAQILYSPLPKDDPAAAGKPEFYRIIIADDQISIQSHPRYWRAITARLSHNWTRADEIILPNAVIEDYPDYPYRGLMIDISRNYQTPAQMRRVLGLMARYGLNHLHFHFADDEAWRLEIPGFPSLTELGSRRGYTLDEKAFLAQTFTGDGNPDNPEGTSNGFFTREDFIDMLRYADSLAITVVPEFESPGHARAARKSLSRRYGATGDINCTLFEETDTSVYTSAQAFHDNVMNPAMPGPYELIKRVATEIKGMYDEAGLDMPALHIGGDEVPAGAWDGSEAVRRLKADHGLTTQKDVHNYFVERVKNTLAPLGIRISGWEDIAIGNDHAFNARISPSVYSVNCWTDSRNGHLEEALRSGYPVVISNVNHFYLDMAYSWHPCERGLTWGGTVDEFKALHGYPRRMCPIDSGVEGKVIGVSGQLFAETIRSARGLETLLLPKMLGLAERAWNADSTYSDAEFQNIIDERMIPHWKNVGFAFHVRQPGIKITPEGRLLMNAPYREATIRYTLDGSEPTIWSPLYTEAIDLATLDARPRQVRAKLWLHGYPSVTTVLFADKKSQEGI